MIRTHGGMAFYCTVCKKEIQPILYEINDDEVACCEECALAEIIAEGGDFVNPETSLDAAVGVQEDELWTELYT